MANFTTLACFLGALNSSCPAPTSTAPVISCEKAMSIYHGKTFSVRFFANVEIADDPHDYGDGTLPVTAIDKSGKDLMNGDSHLWSEIFTLEKTFSDEEKATFIANDGHVVYNPDDATARLFIKNGRGCNVYGPFDESKNPPDTIPSN